MFTKNNFVWLERMFEKTGSSHEHEIAPESAEVFVPALPVSWATSKHYFNEYLPHCCSPG